jgi:Saxitoxin biosynthesis operon protein SxtJ
MALLGKLWSLWKAFAHILGQVQTTILLSLVYLIAIGPIALLSRASGRDLLGRKHNANRSYWVALPPVTADLERAQKQF